MRDYYSLTEEGRRRRLKELASTALEDYDLDVVRIRGMTGGTNGIFRLDTSDGARYAMRIGIGPPIGHPPDEVASELAFLRAIADEPGVAVPTPIRCRDGRWFTSASSGFVPHERPVVIFSWLEGTLLADRVDTIGLEGFGAATARLHRAADRFVPPEGFAAPRYDRIYPYDVPFILFTDVGDDLLPPGRRRVFEQGAELVETGLRRLVDREPPRVLHGDLHGWNIKTHHGRISVFDFEDIVWGWPVQDLATALYYQWSGDHFDRRCAEARTGYEAVAAWPDRGGELETFIIGRTLVMANDVVSQPEWIDEAPGIFERGERRIADMIIRIAERSG